MTDYRSLIVHSDFSYAIFDDWAFSKEGEGSYKIYIERNFLATFENIRMPQY